jgi:ADP-ribose pyrophosphatase
MKNANHYLSKLPERLAITGDSTSGEIELRSEAEERPSEFGVLYEDEYCMFVRDPVIFPGGRTGYYARLVEKPLQSSLGNGTVVIPATSKHVFFIRIFRHATRSWEWEVPRGIQEIGITPVENAMKEVQEEIGVRAEKMVCLGMVKPNTGILSTSVHSFYAVMPETAIDAIKPQYSESIKEVRHVKIEGLKSFVSKNVSCGITLSALMQAHFFGLLRM